MTGERRLLILDADGVFLSERPYWNAALGAALDASGLAERVGDRWDLLADVAFGPVGLQRVTKAVGCNSNWDLAAVLVRALEDEHWRGSIDELLAANESPLFLVATAIIAVLLVVVTVFALLAIHLRYDTMWYVFSDRSMRLRRGIWLIRESTITFENVQNVKVTQGPLQRWFGIADVVVETAGGGGASGEPGGGLGMHSGVIEGVAEAAEIRDSIMSRVRVANTPGLGDESTPESSAAGGQWSAAHLKVLREIRDLAQQAAGN